MSALPRATCPACGKAVPVRKNGTLAAAPSEPPAPRGGRVSGIVMTAAGPNATVSFAAPSEPEPPALDALDAEIARRQAPGYQWAPTTQPHPTRFGIGNAMQRGELTGLLIARSLLLAAAPSEPEPPALDDILRQDNGRSWLLDQMMLTGNYREVYIDGERYVEPIR